MPHLLSPPPNPLCVILRSKIWLLSNIQHTHTHTHAHAYAHTHTHKHTHTHTHLQSTEDTDFSTPSAETCLDTSRCHKTYRTKTHTSCDSHVTIASMVYSVGESTLRMVGSLIPRILPRTKLVSLKRKLFPHYCKL